MPARFERLQKHHIAAHVQFVRERRGMVDELNHPVEICGTLQLSACQNHVCPELRRSEDQLPPSLAHMCELDVVPTDGRHQRKDVDEKFGRQFCVNGCCSVVNRRQSMDEVVDILDHRAVLENPI